MSCKVVVRPEVQDDIPQAAEWYDSREAGLGSRFIGEMLRVFDSLVVNPLLPRRPDDRPATCPEHRI